VGVVREVTTPRRRPRTRWRPRTGRTRAVASALAHPLFGPYRACAVKAAAGITEAAAEATAGWTRRGDGRGNPVGAAPPPNC